MLTSINRYTAIKGCSIYKLNDLGRPNETPAAIDRDITIGEQTSPTTDIPMMGTVSVPDQSRIDNFTISVNINCDSPEAAELNGPGLVGWEIHWVDEVVGADGLPSIQGWVITAHGYVGNSPEATKNSGSENSGDLTMNVVASIKRNVTTGVVAYDIDRRANRLIRNGIDYRKDINALL